MIEVMIASAILLIVSIGVLPLFTRSITNNVQGRLATEAVNDARSELERLMQLDFNSPELTLPDGQPTLERKEYWDQNSHRWLDGTSIPDDQNETLRTVRIRQFNKDAFLDRRVDDAEALPGGSPVGQVQIKEIVVRVMSASQLDAPGKAMTLRIYRGA